MSTSLTTELLATELRTVITRLVKKIRAQSPTRQTLSLTERSVLKQVSEQDAVLPSELALREKVTTQAMSQILNHLSELGYVRREGMESDRRKVNVLLTEAGQRMLNTIRHEEDDWLDHALQQTCTPEELTILHQALEPLNRLLDID